MTYAAEEFRCEPGTTYKAVTIKDEGVLWEICHDSSGHKQGSARGTKIATRKIVNEGTYVDGKLHGVARYYDQDGDLENEVFFEHGIEKGGRLSRIALVKIAKNLSEKAEREGKNLRVLLVGDRTLRYEARCDRMKDADKDYIRNFRQQMIEISCASFYATDAHLDAVEVHFISSTGKLFLTQTIRPDECKRDTDKQP